MQIVQDQRCSTEIELSLLSSYLDILASVKMKVELVLPSHSLSWLWRKGKTAEGEKVKF